MAENLLGTPVIYTLPGRDTGIQPGAYDFNIKEPTPVNEHGEAYKGFARGVDQLQQLSYGGLAALSDVAGADSVRDWAYGKAREQDYEMERNAPAVAQFTDIESVGDAYNWFVGTAAEMAPTSAAIALVSLATGIGGGAAASLATRPAIRTLVGSSIKKMIQQGMTQEAATTAALRGLGAYIGGASGSAFMEAGGNYLEDVKLHGVEGADAARGLLWGIPAGLVEVGLGPETRTISKALTGAVSKEVKEAAERGILKSLGRSAIKGGLGEGGEEVGQNFLGRIATRQDPFTDPQDYFNQFMGGMAGGLIPGLGEGLVDKYNANKEVRVAAAVKAIKDKIAETETTVEQKLNNAKQEQNLALTNLNISTQQNIAELDKSEQELKSNQAQLMHRLTGLYQDQSLDPAIKQQFADEWENELYATAAQLATLKNQRIEYMESAKAEAKKLQKKYTNIINENEIEQIKDAPASIRDFYTKGQDEIKQHIGLGVLEQHVSNEFRKANDRIDQYTSARNEVARQIETQQYVGPMFVQGEQIGQQGNIPQYNEVEVLNWYDKQIADERKYIDKLSSAYEEALIANRKAKSDPYTAEAIASKVYDHFRPAKLASTNIDNIHKQYADKIAKQTKAQYKEDFLNWRTQASPSMGEKFAEYKANKQEVAARRLERKAAIRNEATRLAGHMPAEANALANTITNNRRLQDFIDNTLVNKDINASVPITDRQIRNFGKQFPVETEVDNKPKKVSTKLMTPEAKQTSGNIGQIQKVVNWISNTLDKLPALSGKITVTHTADLSTLPDNVQKAYKGNAALIDVNKGKIYLFADKIATKEQAVRKVLHEGVAHFGLRSIMNNKQLKEFLKLVNVSFKDSEFFKKVKATYPDYDEISVAEEFVAALAERIKLNQKTMSRTAAAYIRVKQFIKRILQELGLINVTEKDVNDVLLASVYNLSVAQERINRTPRAKSTLKDILEGRLWYTTSKLLHKVTKSINSAPASTILNTLISWANKGEIKSDELEWSGLKEWLSSLGNKSVSKENVLRFLYKGGVTVEEIVKSDKPYIFTESDFIQDIWKDSQGNIVVIHYLKKLPEDVNSASITEEKRLDGTPVYTPYVDEEAIRGVYDSLEGAIKALQADIGFYETKFYKYQLPGGENYRELLLTLPPKETTQYFIAYKDGSTIGSGYASKAEARAEMASEFPGRTDLEVRPGSGDRAMTTKFPGNFRSPHFSEPNILAHVRFNERADIEGKRVLFIEEIQSDWAQKGKKEGFGQGVNDAAIDKWLRENGGPIGRADGVWHFTALGGKHEVPGAVSRDEVFSAQREYAKNAIGRRIGVPDAPFVKNTSAWSMLAMKRMIRWAAENGFDKVAWTTGEQQAERYDLSKQVDYIDYVKDGDNTYRVAIVGKDGEGINLHKEVFTESELENYLGKDVARKIVNGEGQWGGGRYTLRGPDLKVGGEGMRGFYDNILPNETNKLIKKWGGKVGETAIITKPGYTAKIIESINAAALREGVSAKDILTELHDAEVVHSFDINSEIKNSILNADKILKDTNMFNMDEIGVLESRDIVGDKDWLRTRLTKEYKNKFQKTYEAVKKALSKPAAYLKDGVMRLDVPTMRDKFVERMQNNVLRMDRLVHGIKDLGGVISNKTNIHEIEKTLSSKISNTTLDFMENMFGISDKRYAEPKEGTLMWLGSQLIDNKKIKKENLLKVMSLVLQAVHAPEANKAIRERYRAIRSMNAKIDSYNKALESGALDAEDVIEIETKISKLQDKIASTKKSYGKMWTAPSGMSDEVAAKILKAFVTKENAKIWDLVFKKNQEINKYVLDILVEAKLLDKDTRELWDRIYPNYVPLKEWEASMALADPSYTQWATGRSLSIGTWVPSKLRTGRTALASNSVVQLLRKAQDAIAVSIRSELDKSLIKLVEDNEKLLSGIFEIDMMPEELELRKQVKKLMAKNRELIGDKITGIKDIMKDLYRGRNDLKDRKVRLEKQFMSRKSDAAKEKVKVKLDKINADIQNATDAIETLKAQRKALLESNEVSAMQKALAAKRTELKRVLDTKGYKITRNPDGTTSKVRKAKYFEGVQNTRAGLGTGTITAVDENGIRRRVWIKDPNLYAAWTGKNIPSWALHPILKYTSIILRTMAKFFTTWNPEFIFTNMFRDMQTASIHIRHLAQDIKRLGIDANELTKRAAKNYKDAAKAMWHYERGTLAETDPWYPIVKMFKKHGGYTTMYNMGTFKKSYNDLQQAIENISSPSATTKVKKGLMNVMGYIEDASTAMENATRLAAFKAISEAMIENNVSAEEAYSRAANASLDLTVNFTKKGTWGPALSSLYLFANASIQSTARMMKAMFPASDKGKPILKRRITRYAGGIMLASFLVAEAGRGIGGDDDDGISHYDKVNEWSRNTNMIIMGPGGKYVKIPLSYGYQIFWVMGQIMSDMIHGRMDVSDSIRRMVASTVANFSPVAADEGWATFLPAQIKPLIQIQMNQNYLNNPIFPDKLPWERGEKPDSQKKWDSTNIALGAAFEWLNWFSGGSKDRSGLIDISPAAAEYVMGQYLGGIGKVALDSIDVAVKLLSGRALDINPITDIPMVRRFAGETGKYATMHEYIKVKTEIETQMNEFNRIKKDKLPIEQAAKVRKMTSAGRLMNSRLTDVQQELKDITERENKLMRSNMSIEYKTSAKKKFEEQKEKIMERFIKAANKAGIK